MSLKCRDSRAIPLRRRNGNSVGPKPYNANHNSSCSSKTTAVFFKKYKKRCFQIRIVFQPHPLRLEDGAGSLPTLVLVACWRFVVLKPRAKSLSSSGEKQRRWQRKAGPAGWVRGEPASLGWSHRGRLLPPTEMRNDGKPLYLLEF